MKPFEEIVKEMFAEANAESYDPICMRPPKDRHRKDLLIDGKAVRIQLTKTQFGENTFVYQLSIAPLEGTLSDDLYEQIRQAIFHDRESFEFPSILGNCRQFIAEIDDG